MPPPVPSPEQEAEASRLLDDEMQNVSELRDFLRSLIALPNQRPVVSDTEVLLAIRFLSDAFGADPSMSDLGGLLDSEIAEMITATPVVTIMEASSADPPTFQRLRCALAMWFPVRFRRMRDACAASLAPPPAQAGQGAIAGTQSGEAFAREVLNRLVDNRTGGQEVFTVGVPALPAGFETLPTLAQPPRAVLQKWEQKCRDAVDGTARRGRNAAPFFPGEVELTRDFLLPWAPPLMRRQVKARAERERSQQVRLHELAFDEHVTVPHVEEEEQMGGFGSFIAMLVKWGIGVASLRLADSEQLSPSQAARAAKYPTRPGCGTCRAVGYATDRTCRFFDVAQFFAYLDVVCKVSSMYTTSHAIEYDRKMRYIWSLRVAQGEQLDWETECVQVHQPTMLDVLRNRPFDRADTPLKRPNATPAQTGQPAAKLQRTSPRLQQPQKTAAKTVPAGEREICGFHQRPGGCHFGDGCKFAHVAPTVIAPKAGPPKGKGKGKGQR